MKAYSHESPNNNFYLHDNKIFIIDINSVQSQTIEEEDSTRVEYSYDVYELPITMRRNIPKHIDDNYAELLTFAIEKDIERKAQPNPADVAKAKFEMDVIDVLVDLEVL